MSWKRFSLIVPCSSTLSRLGFERLAIDRSFQLGSSVTNLKNKRESRGLLTRNRYLNDRKHRHDVFAKAGGQRALESSEKRFTEQAACGSVVRAHL